ncbi:relaxin receptor 1-like isoform X2 [Biomphalaria glabrata]|uniref:Relaxin receptor 1-like isoform X2 n=1 Tax=Biomphalaria glabrata TaxID=6526 RepID=A0A2C9K2X9_BIOGL|nr:relaxin receptor 1-like isoform X2 [Biomphalaria glabrata]
MKLFLSAFWVYYVFRESSGFCADEYETVTKVSTSSKVVNSTVFKTKCPPDTYPCASDGTCINFTLFCDKVKHCKDGSDEASSCDKNLINIYDKIFPEKQEKGKRPQSDQCELEQNYPRDVCQCSQKTELCCRFKNMTMFSLASYSNVTAIDLTGNRITEMSAVPLHLMPRLQKLILLSNGISQLRKGDLVYVHSLTDLRIKQNLITSIENDTFKNAQKLDSLYLGSNRISIVEARSFHGLKELTLLDLSENLISDLNIELFKDLGKLETLLLSDNKLKILQNGIFDSLANLISITLNNNEIAYIEPQSFKYMVNVQSLELRFNRLHAIENGTFINMHRLTYVYFDKFYMCLHASHAQTCLPNGDGISSKENLLESVILRVSVWIVGLFACGGNLLVLLGRFFTKEDNRIHSFFIKNLSMADLLMGLYLLIIAVHDIKYRGEYIYYDEIWRNSWECDFSGMLSTLSTEMSVLTLSVITMDRYISIMYPLSFRKRGLKLSYCIMAFTWAICIFLATLPLMGLDYFGETFYRDNAVCVPLHLHDPRVQGWEFSSFLFLGINFGSFGFIAYAYVAMFYAIHLSALPLRTSRESKERFLVKRFFFIVITDFLCWVPIIIIKILALGGVEISEDLYAWVIVFILPVNSALNPMLYTLTTKLFKKKLFSKFTSVVFRPSPVSDKDSIQSRSSLKNSGQSLGRQMQYCELGLLKRYYPQTSTRKLTNVYVTNGRMNGHRMEVMCAPRDMSNGNSANKRYTNTTLLT